MNQTLFQYRLSPAVGKRVTPLPRETVIFGVGYEKGAITLLTLGDRSQTPEPRAFNILIDHMALEEGDWDFVGSVQDPAGLRWYVFEQTQGGAC